MMDNFSVPKFSKIMLYSFDNTMHLPFTCALEMLAGVDENH